MEYQKKESEKQRAQKKKTKQTKGKNKRKKAENLHSLSLRSHWRCFAVLFLLSRHQQEHSKMQMKVAS